MKNDLMNFEVVSKFCVIGVGHDYDAVFLDKLSSIGSHQGFVTQLNPSEIMDG